MKRNDADHDRQAMVRGDTLLLAVNMMFAAAAWLIGLKHGRAWEALLVGLPLAAAAVLLWLLARGSLAARLGMATVAMALVSLHIHVGYGQELYHFGVFVTLAILLVYRDWRVPVLGAGLIAVQHATFNVLQQAGWGVSCFTETGWDVVAMHAAYVIVQTAMEVHIALRLAYEARRDFEVQRLLLDADGKVNLDLREARASTELASAVLATLRQMREAVAQVQRVAHRLHDTAGRTVRDNAHLAERTMEQAGQLVQAAAAVQQVAQGVARNSEGARQARVLAQSTADIAGRGSAAVREAEGTMQEISASSDRISEIIALIDGIAFQTNILALNAAVEAARAGEQGRGFAVVASEVRALAQRSAAAAQETKALILESRARVASGAQRVADAGRTVQEMQTAVGEVAGLVAQIAEASGAQARNIEEVSASVSIMETATEANSRLVEECAEAARAVAAQADLLAQAVSRFQLGDTEAARPAPERTSFALPGRPVPALAT